MKKYTLKKEGDKFRIIALRDIPKWNVKTKDAGGLVDGEVLSHEGDSWIDYDSVVINASAIMGNALISHSNVSGGSMIHGNAVVTKSNIKGALNIKDAKLIRATLEGGCLIKGDIGIEDSKIIRSDIINESDKLLSLYDCEIENSKIMTTGNIDSVKMTNGRIIE